MLTPQQAKELLATLNEFWIIRHAEWCKWQTTGATCDCRVPAMGDAQRKVVAMLKDATRGVR
tara:strand:- start:1318 stop:1503 length:186 start_codon:yes stop_codon:yes gene_type:complete